MAIEDLLHPYLGRYLEAPAWVRASAARMYALLPTRVRLGSAYGAFCDEIAAFEDAQELKRSALRKLEETLAWALETVPAYQRFRGLLKGGCDPREALACLPVTDKLDIKREPERYVSKAIAPALRLETFTGGSTRNPMRFYLEKHVTRSKEYAFIQDFRARLGEPSGDRGADSTQEGPAGQRHLRDDHEVVSSSDVRISRITDLTLPRRAARAGRVSSCRTDSSSQCRE